MKHVTHTILLGVILAAAWLVIASQTQPITDSTMLLISGILYGVGWLVTLAAMFFMPELPRLRREQGRTPPHHDAWALLLFSLVSGLLLFMDAYGLLVQGQPVRYAAAGAALNTLGACLSVANERLCVCWNKEGFVLRTALGNVHRFRWEQLTGHHTYWGATYLYIAGKSYHANLNSKQLVSFLQASAGRQ